MKPRAYYTVVACLLAACGCGRPKSFDEVGGTRLIYDLEADEPNGVPMAFAEARKATIETLRNRIRRAPFNARLREDGDRQIAVEIAGDNPSDVERCKEFLRYRGQLQMLIAADHSHDADLIRRAQATSDSRIVDDENRVVGQWANVDRRHFQSIEGLIVRDRESRQVIELPNAVNANDSDAIWRRLDDAGIKYVQALLVVDPVAELNLSGAHLAVVTGATDDQLKPCIRFSLSSSGEAVIRFVTSSNLHRRLAIVLDDVVLSAPSIQSTIGRQGRITGKFTQDEVDSIVTVLQAGQLAVPLSLQPVSETDVAGKHPR